jgi:GMP synthase-like glutamine amidotransferase
VRVLIVGNRGDSDPGLVGARLGELGFGLERNEREYPREWKSLAGIDLLLLLGSEWSVYWESNAKEVAAEADLVRTAYGRGVPVFAICYGAQLVSHVFGGRVTPANQPEIGWHDVTSSTLPEVVAGEWFQWHGDVFTVPSDFRTIASNDVGPQAMTARRVFACQFHPEVTAETIRRWSSGLGVHELERVGLDPKHLCEMSVERVLNRAPATNRLVDWFLAEVT